jgi:hypothetical protein
MASTLNVKGDTNVTGNTTILGKFNPIIDSDRDIISKPPSYWRTLGVGIYTHFVKTPISGWFKTGLLETIIPCSNPDEFIIRQEYKEFAAHLIRWEDTVKNTWSNWHRYTISTSVGDIILYGDVIIKGRLMFNEVKHWWMQDSVPNLGHLGRGDVGFNQPAGRTANIINWSGSEWRMTTFAQDGNICIQVSGHGGKCLHCDRRLKENIKPADTNNILTKINQLLMQNYNFIDKQFYKGQEVYGLIAQEVKEIFPEAVEINKQHIPNINKSATHQLVEDNVILIVDNETKIDDSLMLLVNDKQHIVKVLKKTHNDITVNKWSDYKDNDIVFVYGTEIDDFHALNQQYLGILSFGGIQELTKRTCILSEQNNELTKQNNDLRTRLEKLETLLQVKP